MKRLWFYLPLCLLLSCSSQKERPSSPLSPKTAKLKLPQAYQENRQNGWTVIHYKKKAELEEGRIEKKALPPSSPRPSPKAYLEAKGKDFVKFKNTKFERAIGKMSFRVRKGMPIGRESKKILPMPEGRVQNLPSAPQMAPLKAKEIDDNKFFDNYLSYFQKNKHLLPKSYQIDITERYILKVQGEDGKGIPNAVITITSSDDKILWQGRTDSRGQLLFFPRAVAEAKGVKEFLISYSYRGEGKVVSFQRSPYGSDKPWVLKIPVKKIFQRVNLDLVFLLDATGSMSDEIRRIQFTLQNIVRRIQSVKAPSLRIRYGMVLYRDRGDDFVAKRYPFTEDLARFHRALQEVVAAGGGDYPEAMNTGLFVAIEQMDWDFSEESLRLVFLVADAPPHLNYSDDIPYPQTLQRAIQYGVKIYPIAASGLNPQGSFVMRQIALLTQAKFLFIDYGKGTARSHGIQKASGPSNNLDDIVVNIVQSELKAFLN